jgi:hypothetical protein
MLGMAGTLSSVAAALAGAGLFLVAWLVSVWLVCAALVALGAQSRGRSVPLWLFLAILLTPLPAAVMLLLFPDRTDLRARREARQGRNGLRLCPSCGEVVRGEARRCRFCLADLTRKAEAATRLLPDERVEPRLQ